MWAVTPSTYMEPSTPTSNWRLSGNICRRTRGCSKIKIGRKPFTLILLRGRGTGICGGCPASKTLMEMRLCFPRLRNSNNRLRACETIPHPPNPSCCRSCGGMRGWPLPRPTHAPATTLKTNSNSAPIKPMSFPSSAWECVPRSSASHSCSRNRLQNKRQQRPNHRHVSFPSSERVKESPKPPNPSCCRSCGGMRGWPLPRPTHAPATTLKTNGNSAPIKPMSFPSSAWECVPRSSASHSCSRNRPQNKHSPHRKAGWPSHRNPGGILSHPPQKRQHPGSAVLALEIDLPFAEYHFGDLRPRRVNALKRLASEYDGRCKIFVESGDANDIVERFCARLSQDRNLRSVVFLDPYGLQVNWSSLKALAATKRADVWCLAPMEGLIRQLSHDREKLNEDKADRLDAFLGTPDWRDFYKASQGFGFVENPTESRKIDIPGLEDFVLQRLRKIFVGEVFAPLPIFRMGTRHHMFSLYCAIANPSENAVNAAGRIVDYLRKKINGGGKLSQKGNHVPVPH